jgi:hypothetical protein
MSDIYLFSAHFRPSISRPPVDILCQAVDVKGEKLLWADGLMVDHPILVPISAVGKVSYKGTFRDFMRQHMTHAMYVLEVSQGQHSPTMLARAVQCMSRDPSLSADEALDLVVEEALDLIDVDSMDRGAFLTASPSMTMA